MKKLKFKPFKKTTERIKAFLKRRPHRSFRLSRRRDYVRPLNLPGYLKFTKEVNQTLWLYRKPMLKLAAFYAVVTVLIIGIASQSNYAALKDYLDTSNASLMFTDFVGQASKLGLLFYSVVTGNIAPTLSSDQQIYAVIIFLMTWLTCVWLLRNLLAGHKVKLRDALYNAGSPILSTFAVASVIALQILPLAIAIIVFNAAQLTGFMDNGVQSMMIWVGSILLGTLTIYWFTGTLFALIIVTLPGMYPYQAIKAAGDMVVGRRFKIILRLIWLALVIVLTWLVILVPLMILDSWLKGVWPATDWVPFIPVVLLVLSSISLVWAASYIYLLYRKVVADESQPA